MKKNILVTFSIPPESIESIKDTYEIEYLANKDLSHSDNDELIRKCHVIISVFGRPIDNDIIAKAENLELIANYGVGYDNIDVDFATRKGIAVTNTPGPVTEPTAELALTLLLALVRRIPQLDQTIRTGQEKWGIFKNLGGTIINKKLGIIGLGNIGKALARRAISGCMEVYYYNRNRLPADEEKRLGVKYLHMDELLLECDVISLNCPLNESTYHLIGEKQLKLMKPTAYLVNTARGPVVDENALIKVLQEKKIAGAAIDVYEHEPQIPEALRILENVVLTPHLGSATMESRIEMGEAVVQNIEGYFNGKNPPNIINHTVLS